MATVKVRGEGGVVWEMDEPLPRDVLQRLADKRLTLVDDDGGQVEYVPPAEPEDDDDVPPELAAFEAEPAVPRKAAKKAAAKSA